MYRGKPVILRDDIPDNIMGFINEKTSLVRILNWKTGKVSKTMTVKQFNQWIDKQNKKAK